LTDSLSSLKSSSTRTVLSIPVWSQKIINETRQEEEDQCDPFVDLCIEKLSWDSWCIPIEWRWGSIKVASATREIRNVSEY
jgi:hypothetical protein